MTQVAANRSAARTLIALAIGLLVVLGSCSNEHDDIAKPAANDPTETGQTPPVPTGFGAVVGDRSVRLFWTIDADKAASVESYRVYREAYARAEERIADGVEDTTYVDQGLTNGIAYTYRVSAVLTNDLEGKKSAPLLIFPAVYGVLIANGITHTNSTTVSVALTAPQGTSAMRLSESEDFADASWRTFAPSTSFTLEPGEGEHTIYAQFRDAGGQETNTFSDTITLDMVAEIASVGYTHDGGGDAVPPGTIVHFSLDAGEPDGQASVDIGGERFGIVLFDDGAHADGAADDGEYGVDFEIPPGMEVVEAEIIGHFQDVAGNTADDRSGPETLTTNVAPDAVVLGPVNAISSSEIQLEWTQSDAADFARYEVRRSESEFVGTEDELAASISLGSSTEMTDDDLVENTRYYYRVFVYDTGDSLSGSNELSATTQNEPPAMVDLRETDHSGWHVSLDWDQSQAHDFDAYKLWKATIDNPGAFLLLETIAEASATSFTDLFSSEVTDSTYYVFYKVSVHDDAADSTVSNVVAVRPDDDN